MEATASKHSPLEPRASQLWASSQHLTAVPVSRTGSESWWRRTVVRVVVSGRSSRAVGGAAGGPGVGAGGAARKPLAALGLGLKAALWVRSAPAVGAGLRLVSHPTRP